MPKSETHMGHSAQLVSQHDYQRIAAAALLRSGPADRPSPGHAKSPAVVPKKAPPPMRPTPPKRKPRITFDQLFAKYGMLMDHPATNDPCEAFFSSFPTSPF